jgi:hypothetical protein
MEGEDHIIPQGLKPGDSFGLFGTAEAVPYPILHARAFLRLQPAGKGAGATTATEFFSNL